MEAEIAQKEVEIARMREEIARLQDETAQSQDETARIEAEVQMRAEASEEVERKPYVEAEVGNPERGLPALGMEVERSNGETQ